MTTNEQHTTTDTVATRLLDICERAERALRDAGIAGLRDAAVEPHNGEVNTIDPAKIITALRRGDLTVRVDLHYWRGSSTDLVAEQTALTALDGIDDVEWDGDGSDDYGPTQSGCLVIEGIRDPGQYRIMDRTGGGVTEDIEADTDAEAIERGRDWIEEGDWSEPWYGDEELYETIDLPCVVAPHLYRIDEDGSGLDIDAMQHAADDCTGRYSREQPECRESEEGEHDWRTPFGLVGGIEENPGVWGHGGAGVSVTEVCALCGCYRTTHDPGSQRNPDEPIESVRFSPADESSSAWVESLRANA